MVNGLLIAASILILTGLAMLLWAPGPGWPVLLAGVAVLIVAVVARAATHS